MRLRRSFAEFAQTSSTNAITNLFQNRTSYRRFSFVLWERPFAAHGLNHASFDVLATLRRSGSPYRLSPGDLLATMMITSGTMTNRIDQLEKAGLVERIENPKDGRSVIISLTDKGFAIIDAAVTAHVETQARLTSALSQEESAELNELLAKFLKGFEKH